MSNILVKQLSCITGVSTYNQRIEHMWQDVHRCVTVLFADTFRMLEAEGKLNSLNEVDIFCLHYVYKPRINSTLQSFVESWNNHSMSSEGSLTPTQLYIQGFIETNQTPVQPNAHFVRNYLSEIMCRYQEYVLNHVQFCCYFSLRLILCSLATNLDMTFI